MPTPINFVRAHVVEQHHPILLLAENFKQAEGTLNIGFYECARAYDGAVDMRFGGKIADRIHLIIVKYFLQGVRVTYIALDEKVALRKFFLNSDQILGIAGISQLIDINNPPVKIRVGKHVINEIGSDKTATPGDQDVFHLTTCIL